jgi:hypothetical protein
MNTPDNTDACDCDLNPVTGYGLCDGCKRTALADGDKQVIGDAMLARADMLKKLERGE